MVKGKAHGEQAKGPQVYPVKALEVERDAKDHSKPRDGLHQHVMHKTLESHRRSQRGTDGSGSVKGTKAISYVQGGGEGGN